jgi:hypothetical protein
MTSMRACNHCDVTAHQRLDLTANAHHSRPAGDRANKFPYTARRQAHGPSLGGADPEHLSRGDHQAGQSRFDRQLPTAVRTIHPHVRSVAGGTNGTRTRRRRRSKRLNPQHRQIRLAFECQRADASACSTTGQQHCHENSWRPHAPSRFTDVQVTSAESNIEG